MLDHFHLQDAPKIEPRPILLSCDTWFNRKDSSRHACRHFNHRAEPLTKSSQLQLYQPNYHANRIPSARSAILTRSLSHSRKCAPSGQQSVEEPWYSVCEVWPSKREHLTFTRKDWQSKQSSQRTLQHDSSKIRYRLSEVPARGKVSGGGHRGYHSWSGEREQRCRCIILLTEHIPPVAP